MKGISVIFLVILSLSVLIGCGVKDNSQWVEDIEYFSNQLPKKHKDFYKLYDSLEFKNKVDDLKNNISSLDDITIILELQKILASMRVSHTMIPIQYGAMLKNLPLKVEIFDDGLFIIGIESSKDDYLAQKIVAINNIPVEEIFKKIEPLISYENEYWLKSQIPEFIVKPQILRYINLLGDNDYVNIQLDNDRSFDLALNTTKAEMIFCPYMNELILYKNRHKTYWYETISDRTLYIQYNKCQEDKAYPFDDFVDDIITTIENNSIHTVLVDIRLNAGGNSMIIKPLIRGLQAYDDVDYYAAISRRTFSSGRFAARDLKVQLNADLIGEPTGGSPKSYGESVRMILPNSNLQINYCVNYFSLMDSDKDFFEPDIPIEYNAKDLLVSNDLVLDYIQQISKP